MTEKDRILIAAAAKSTDLHEAEEIRRQAESEDAERMITRRIEQILKQI